MATETILSEMAPGTWRNLSVALGRSTALADCADVNVLPWYPGGYPMGLWGPGCSAGDVIISSIFVDDCGGGWDSKRRWLLAVGGGHGCSGWFPVLGFQLPVPGAELATDDFRWQCAVDFSPYFPNPDPRYNLVGTNPWPGRGVLLDPTNPPWQTWNYNCPPYTNWPLFTVTNATWVNGVATISADRPMFPSGQGLEGTTRFIPGVGFKLGSATGIKSTNNPNGVTSQGFNKGSATVRLGPATNQINFDLATDPGTYVASTTGFIQYSPDSCWNEFPPPPVSPPSMVRDPVMYADGTTPGCRHTKGWPCYIPDPIDKYWIGGYTVYPSQGGDNYPYLADPNAASYTTRWTRLPEISSVGAPSSGWQTVQSAWYAAGDGGSGELLFGTTGVMRAYALRTQSYRNIMASSEPGAGWSSYQGAALDTRRNVWYWIGPWGDANAWYTGLNPDGTGGTLLPSTEASRTGRTATPIAAGQTTVPLTGTGANWPAQGTVYFNGTTPVTYQQFTANLLSGCTGVPTLRCEAFVKFGQRKPMFRSLALPGSPTAHSVDLLPMTTFTDLGLFQFNYMSLLYAEDLDLLIAWVTESDMWTCPLRNNQTTWTWTKTTYGGDAVGPENFVTTHIPIRQGQSTYVRYAGDGYVVAAFGAYESVWVARLLEGTTPTPPHAEPIVLGIRTS